MTKELAAAPVCVGVTDAARMVGLSRHTLTALRKRGADCSPPWFKPNAGRILYPVQGLRDWATARSQEAAR